MLIPPYATKATRTYPDWANEPGSGLRSATSNRPSSVPRSGDPEHPVRYPELTFPLCNGKRYASLRGTARLLSLVSRGMIRDVPSLGAFVVAAVVALTEAIDRDEVRMPRTVIPLSGLRYWRMKG